MKLRSIIASLSMPTSLALSASLISGCAANEDVGTDTAFARELPTPVHSSELSSSYVKPDTWYLGCRSISLLVEVDALTPTEKAVAERADGIIGNSPANGCLGARELGDLELPQNFDTLFPEEQQALPKLWSLLELNAVTTVASPCTYPSYNGLVTLIDHEPFVAPVNILPIASLPSELQTTAARVQLRHDSDGNSSTITGIDLYDAGAQDEPFTSKEAGQFSEILVAIEEAMVPPDPALPRWVMPDLTCSGTVVTGDLTTAVNSEQELVGEWKIDDWGPRGAGVAAQTRAQFSSSQPDDRIVTFRLDDGDERSGWEAGDAVVLDAPKISTVRGKRVIRVELWRAGVRAQMLELELPDQVPEGEEDLAHFLPIESEATDEIFYPNFDRAFRGDDNVQRIGWAGQPSEPDIWRQLMRFEYGPYRRFGTFTLVQSQTVGTATLYRGGWLVYREEGQFVDSLVPQFEGNGGGKDAYSNGDHQSPHLAVSEDYLFHLDLPELYSHDPSRRGYFLATW